jgi:glycosyltransferase involved in cell wall biosynthesis
MHPRLSIGLPVYNGGRYLSEALEALLRQKFIHFELIISDNASTDDTANICAGYAQRDSRIRYYRNEKNLGAARNYSIVFERAIGTYFKWAAHDDICLPRFLSRCVEVLDADPEVVLCYTAAEVIDENGTSLAQWGNIHNLSDPDGTVRLRAVHLLAETLPIWGVMRRDVLAATRLLGNYPGHDRPLLAEMALHGRFYEVPEVLFQSRDHGERSIRAYDYRNPITLLAWYDPERAGQIAFPQWRLLREHLAAINRAPLTTSQRLAAYRVTLDWSQRHRHELGRDLWLAAGRLPWGGHAIRAGLARFDRLARLVARLRRTIPKGAQVVLVDDDTFALEPFAGWHVLPFLERDGRYWGRPLDSRHAVDELERMRQQGAGFIVFGWPALWWLDHYDAFAEHLRTRYRCVTAGRDAIVFDLRAASGVEP